MKHVQPVMVTVNGHNSTVHLAIEDRSGDSAIIEYIGGQPRVHHGRQFTIMTNDPPFDEQLSNLARFDFTDATRNTPLPGNVNPLDRFNLAAGASLMVLDPDNIELSGDVTSKFRKAKQAPV